MAKTEQPAKQPTTRRRRLLRWCVRVPLALLGAACLYLLAVLILGWVSVNNDYRPATAGVEIRVWSNGVHTDFAMPVRTEVVNWGSFAPLDGKAPAWWTPYVLIGWGDHDFYVETPTWNDFSVATTLKAVFWPTDTVMHLQYLESLPAPKDGCVKLVLSEAEYRRLVAYIKQSFALDADGQPRLLAGKGYGANDVFYRALGSYHLFDTCNNWANAALKHTGVKTALWSPLGYAIFDHLKNH